MTSQQSFIKILFIADTHLGFDFPFRPRVERRRRGPDFFANFRAALQPALENKIDMVIHGGDLFYRTRIPDQLVDMVMEPIREVADYRVPFIIIPGNHESARIPSMLSTVHPNIHIFSKPQTLCFTIRGQSISVSGFPFTRKIKSKFNDVLAGTEYQNHQADIKILCMHQAIEGATVGVQNYTFRYGEDILPVSAIPTGFAAILSGHIHRSQILTQDLSHNPLHTPIIYPGAIERTSIAERYEEKHYTICTFASNDKPGGELISTEFIPLDTRKMIRVDIECDINPNGKSGDQNIDIYIANIKKTISTLDQNAIVQIHLRGQYKEQVSSLFPATFLRQNAPKTMSISIGGVREFNTRKRRELE